MAKALIMMQVEPSRGLTRVIKAPRAPTTALVKACISLFPPVQIDDIGKGAAPHRAKLPERIANGQNSIGMDTGWQAQNVFDFRFK
jgi:hypothetical protein